MGAGDKGINELTIVEVGNSDVGGGCGISWKRYWGPGMNLGGGAEGGLVEGEGVGKRECLLHVFGAAAKHGVVRPLGFQVGGFIDRAVVHGNDLVNQADEVFGAVRRKHQQPVRGAGGVGDNEFAQARARWRVQAIERLIEEGDRRARGQGGGTGNQLALAGA